MTQHGTYTKKAERPRWGSLCLVFLLTFSFFLLLRRADVATNCMRSGLSLCARAVVPSLFPFMVLSELLIASGAGEWLTSFLAPLLGKFPGLSRSGCCAVILGLICGFPVGARCAILAYEKGTLSHSECECVLACSSIPSSAFLIGTVGTTLWGNATFGVHLYLCAIVSALLSGFLLYVVKKKKIKEDSITNIPPSSPVRFDVKMFPKSVKNATMATLFICAYVVFFSTLVGAIELILFRFGATSNVTALLSSLLELSGGVSAASQLGNYRFATALTGAAVGWSGLSVHCQMLTLCEGHDISMRPYFVAKLIQTVLCALLMSLLK